MGLTENTATALLALKGRWRREFVYGLARRTRGLRREPVCKT
jgi:hypothetical protein